MLKSICLVTLLAGMAVPMIAEDEYLVVEQTAIQALESIQKKSINLKSEFCGWVVEDGVAVRATMITRGDEDSCELPEVSPELVILASFHTHAQHNPEYWSEVPSYDDLQGDIEDEVFGFVGTPGGRVWLIDPFQEEVFLICGEACIPQDPNYNASEYPKIPDQFSPEELLELLED